MSHFDWISLLLSSLPVTKCSRENKGKIRKKECERNRPVGALPYQALLTIVANDTLKTENTVQGFLFQRS